MFVRLKKVKIRFSPAKLSICRTFCGGRFAGGRFLFPQKCPAIKCLCPAGIPAETTFVHLIIISHTCKVTSVKTSEQIKLILQI